MSCRRPTVAAVLIVRDEEDHLPGCLASLAGVADEIVVVDTGSSDATVPIARAHGATVDAIVWPEDFAAARNDALARATSDWILSIDADERVVSVDHRALEAILADLAIVAGTVAFQPDPGSTRYPELRVFRNEPSLRFEGEIHETVDPAVRRTVRSSGRVVVSLPIALDHVTAPDQRIKPDRDLPLLRRRLARDPGHVRSWRELGVLLAVTGDPVGAEEAWTRAVDLVRADPQPGASDLLAYGDLVVAAMQRGDPARADALLGEAGGTFGALPALHALRAGVRLERSDDLGAVADLEALTRLDPDATIVGVSVDRRLLGAGAWDRLGSCRFRLGDDAAAVDAFREANRIEPTPERRARLVVAEHRVARAGGAR